MEQINIETLLEKYFDGDTTLAQEKQLTNYFSGNNVALNLKQYQPMFQFFDQQKTDVFNQEIKLKSNNKIVWFSIAASIVLLVGLGTFYNMNDKQASSEEGLGSYQSPEIAFQETQKALQMLSNNVNVGINSVAYINEYQITKNKIFVE
ncbi:MAG: hypothetical protein H7174_10575 [Flavobacterium sp.]|nr:hypothetical protein [Flavobacterium sp.]